MELSKIIFLAISLMLFQLGRAEEVVPPIQWEAMKAQALKAIAAELPYLDEADLELWQIQVDYFYATGHPPRFSQGPNSDAQATITFVRPSTRRDSTQHSDDGFKMDCMTYLAVRVVLRKGSEPQIRLDEVTSLLQTPAPAK